jgi:hypothetical protein
VIGGGFLPTLSDLVRFLSLPSGPSLSLTASQHNAFSQEQEEPDFRTRTTCPDVKSAALDTQKGHRGSYAFFLYGQRIADSFGTSSVSRNADREC